MARRAMERLKQRDPLLLLLTIWLPALDSTGTTGGIAAVRRLLAIAGAVVFLF